MNLEGRFFTGALKDKLRVVLETGIALLRRPSGEPGEEVLLPRTTRNSKRGLWKRSVSLYGGLASGTWASWMLCNERLWKRASFSIGTPSEDQGVDAVLKRTSRERWDFALSGGVIYREIREVCEKMAPETGNSLHRAPVGEPGGGFVHRGRKRDSKRALDECSVSLSLFLSVYGSSVRGT